MARLVYSLSVSLDGYAAAEDGSLDWVHVDEALHRLFNDEGRAADAFLYGTRMYELMSGYWPTALDDPDATPAMREWAVIWRETPKIVFSHSLESVAWNSRLVRGDAVAEVARLKAEGLELGVGGPGLAGSLLRAGLVDEVRLYVNPVLLGGGIPFFPALDAPIVLRPLESRPFPSGVVLLRYEVVAAAG
jgi:dihydrofolate reductase